jgi:hypothetical protein
MHFDSIPLIVTALLVLIGAGLFRVGLYLMHFKGESRQGTRRAWLFYHARYCLRCCGSAHISFDGNEDRVC